MKKLLTRASLCFAAGAVGGLVNAFVLWWSGEAGIPSAFGVKLAPALTDAWLYERVVWGGLWGFLLFPARGSALVLKGMFASLAPTLAALFLFLPLHGSGFFGLGLGRYTAMFVVLYNAIWGAAAALWLKLTGAGSGD